MEIANSILYEKTTQNFVLFICGNYTKTNTLRSLEYKIITVTKHVGLINYSFCVNNSSFCKKLNEYTILLRKNTCEEI